MTLQAFSDAVLDKVLELERLRSRARNRGIPLEIRKRAYRELRAKNQTSLEARSWAFVHSEIED